MASWKYDGKIAGNFPWGAVNFDVKKIIFADSTHTYSQDGDETNAVNKIYYIPAGVIPTQANLESFRIWYRYQVNDLVSGTQNVCIEYVPKDDVQLSSLAIFTNDAESSKTVNFGIIHESGLVVYLSTEDDVGDQITKYNLSGYRRYKSSMSGITLKKGLKYYIQWTNTNHTFKPAYFENTAGNYLNWTHGNLQGKSVANLNSAKTYLGVVTDVATWLAADENDFMISGVGQGGLSNSEAFVRNATTVSTIGEIGTALSVSEKDKLLRLSSGSTFAYLGNDYSESSTKILDPYHIYTKNNTLDNTKYKGIKTTAKGILDDLNQYDYCIYNGDTIQSIVEKGHIYQKTGNIIINDEIDLTSISGDVAKIMAILNKSASRTPYGNIAIEKGSISQTDYTGYVFTLKSGYYRDFGQNDAGYTCATVPTVDKTIYYITDQGSLPGGGWCWSEGLWFYDSTAGEKWKFVAQNGNVSNLDNYVTMITFASAIQEIYINGSITLNGDLTILAKTHYTGSYISNDLRGQTVQTDKKFYLEINGSEV